MYVCTYACMQVHTFLLRYYALGHFAKFIPHGSIRVNIEIEGESLITPKYTNTNAYLDHAFISPLVGTAFTDTSGHVVVVLLNRSENTRGVKIVDEVGGGSFQVEVPPFGIQTYLYNAH